MWTIAKLAFKEILYKRIFLITILMTVAFLLFYAVGIHFAAKETAENLAGIDAAIQKNFFATQLLGVGLYFSSFITALLAILSSVGSVANEIDSHQIDTWLARPLPRRSVIIGKFIGLSGLLIGYAVFLFSGVVLINQFVGGGMLAVDLSFLQFTKALGLFVIQPVILVAVALLLSSVTTTINGGIVLIILYGIGFIGGFIEQLGALMEKASLINFGIISSLIFPIDSLFRRMTIGLFDTADDPLSFASQGMFGSVSSPSDAMLIYTFLYGALGLWLAIRKFSARDL